MNKKLFALLTSAAMMAAVAPSVFAENNENNENNDNASGATATLEFIPSAEKVAAGEEVTFDVAISADVKLCTLQFAFTAENGEIVNFVFNEDNLKSTTAGLAFDDWGYKGKMTEEEKAQFVDNEDYQVMAYDKDFEDADGIVPNKLVIGTLTVKAADDAEDGTAINISTSTAKITAGGIANYDIEEYANWTTVPASVTVSADASQSESESESESSSESTSTSESSSESTSTSESSSKATTNTSSKSNTNGTTSNTNTGAATTAAVALAASAAALVVISKKRK